MKKRIAKVGQGKETLALMFTAILLASFGMLVDHAYAMGQAPSTCPNRYDATITAMKITAGHRTIDPIADPGAVLRLRSDMSYTVTFTMHIPSQSSQANSLNGTTWYDTSAPGFQLGTCVSDVLPNQDITITKTESHPGNLAPSTTQNVTWSTLGSEPIEYSIKWVDRAR